MLPSVCIYGLECFWNVPKDFGGFFFLINMNLSLQIFPVSGLNLLLSLIFLALYIKYHHCIIIFLQFFTNCNLKSHISLFLSDRPLHNMKDQGQMIYEERLLIQSDGSLRFWFLFHYLPKNMTDSEHFSKWVCNIQVYSAVMQTLWTCTSAADPQKAFHDTIAQLCYWDTWYYVPPSEEPPSKKQKQNNINKTKPN